MIWEQVIYIAPAIPMRCRPTWINLQNGAFVLKEHTWTKAERKEEYWRANTTEAYVNLWIYPTHSYIHPTPGQLEVYKDLQVETTDLSPYQQEFLKFVGKHGDIDKAMQAYCADVTAMDQAPGRLFDFLQEQGLDPQCGVAGRIV